MKTLFIEARKKFKDINIDKDIEKIKKKLKNNQVHLLYSIQYKELAEKIKKQLEKENIKVIFQQILGCSNIKPKSTLFLIGSGSFHAIQLALRTNKEVYVYPGLSKIGKKEIEKQKKKIKAKIKKFYSSKNIGIIISVKQGQKVKVEKVKKQLENRFKDKSFHFFIADNINEEELENFKISLWINTACPGLEYQNKKIINYQTLKEPFLFLKEKKTLGKRKEQIISGKEKNR